MVENHGRERVVTPAGRADRQTLITIDFMTVPYGKPSRCAFYGMQLGGETSGMALIIANGFCVTEGGQNTHLPVRSAAAPIDCLEWLHLELLCVDDS